MNNKIDRSSRAYPKAFHPDALWNKEEIMGYLSISDPVYYELEMEIPTFRVGRRRVAFAKDVIALAERIKLEQNPPMKNTYIGRVISSE